MDMSMQIKIMWCLIGQKKDCRCTSLKPLFLMLNFLALTKSKSFPYSSLKKKVEID